MHGVVSLTFEDRSIQPLWNQSVLHIALQLCWKHRKMQQKFTNRRLHTVFRLVHSSQLVKKFLRVKSVSFGQQKCLCFCKICVAEDIVFSACPVAPCQQQHFCRFAWILSGCACVERFAIVVARFNRTYATDRWTVQPFRLQRHTKLYSGRWWVGCYI